MKNRIDCAISTIKDYVNPRVDNIKGKLEKIDQDFFGEQLDILGVYFDALANVSNFDMCAQFMIEHKERMDVVFEITDFVCDKMLEIGTNKAKRGAIHAYISHIIYLASMKSTPYRFKIGADYKAYSKIEKAQNFTYSSTINFPVKFVVPTLILQDRAKYIIVTSENPYNVTEELLWFGSFLRDNKIVSSITELKESIASKENCVAFLSPFDTAKAIMEIDMVTISQCHVSLVKHLAYPDYYSWIEPLLEYASNYMSLTFSIIIKEPLQAKIKNLSHIQSFGKSRVTKSIVVDQKDALKTTVSEFRKAVAESLELGFASNIVVYIPSSEIAYRMSQSLAGWYKESKSVYVWDNPNDPSQSPGEISKNFRAFMKNNQTLFAHYFIMPLFLNVRGDIPMIDENFGNNVFKVVFINTVYENHVPFVTRIIDSGLNLENGKLVQIHNLDRDKRQRKCVRAPGYKAISIVPDEPPQPKLPKVFVDGISNYIKKDIIPQFDPADIAKIVAPELHLESGKTPNEAAVSLFVKYLKNGGRVLVNNPRSPRLSKYFEPRSDVVTLLRCFMALACVKPQPPSQMIIDHGLSIDPFCALLTLFRTCLNVDMNEFKTFVDSEDVFDVITSACEEVGAVKSSFMEFGAKGKKMFCEGYTLTTRIGSENLHCPVSFYAFYTSYFDCYLIHGIGSEMATGCEILPSFGITSTYNYIFKGLLSKKIKYKIAKRGEDQIEIIYNMNDGYDDENCISDDDENNNNHQNDFDDDDGCYDYRNDTEKNPEEKSTENETIVKKCIELANKLMPLFGTSIFNVYIGCDYIMEIVGIGAADYNVVLHSYDEIYIYFLDMNWIANNYDLIKDPNNNIRIAFTSGSIDFGYYQYDDDFDNIIDLDKNAYFAILANRPIDELYRSQYDPYNDRDDTRSLIEITYLIHADSELPLDINEFWKIDAPGFHYFGYSPYIDIHNTKEIDGLKVKIELSTRYSHRIVHYPNTVSKDAFMYRVHQAIQHFGYRIEFCDGVKYIPLHNSEALGYVPISVYGEKTRNEVDQFMEGKKNMSAIHEWISFNPSPTVISRSLLMHKETQKEIVEFLRRNKLGAKIEDGTVKVLKTEEKDCVNAVEDIMHGFIPKFRALPVRKGIRIMQAVKAVQQAKRPNWEVLQEQKVVIIPADDSYDEIEQLVDSEPSVFGCTYLCETPQVTTTPVTMWFEDGHYESKPICMQCFSKILDKFDGVQNLKGEKLPGFGLAPSKNGSDGHVYPILPIGQVVLAITDSHHDDWTTYIRNWVWGIKMAQYRSDHQHFSACPDHPDMIQPIRECPHCPLCSKFYCNRCKNWHTSEDPCERTTGMRCPRCGIAVFKFTGCNHITCPCGAHWCYVCGAGPWATQGECYEHLRVVHGGFFDQEEGPQFEQMHWDFGDEEPNAQQPNDANEANREEEEEEEESGDENEGAAPFDDGNFRFVSSDDENPLDSDD